MICIKSLYFDRIVPTVGEVQKRLRSFGWRPTEASAALYVCACDREGFILLPPSHGKAAQILLRSEPLWFQGWVCTESSDSDKSDMIPETVWQVFSDFLSDYSEELVSGAEQSAAILMQEKENLPPCLRALSLGEWRLLVEMALLPERGLLKYDPLHGGRLLPTERCQMSANRQLLTGVKARLFDSIMEEIETTPPGSGVCSTSEDGSSVEHTDSSPLKPWSANASFFEQLAVSEAVGDLTGTVATLRRCIFRLCHEGQVPTFTSLQTMLCLECGWSAEEAATTPAFCNELPHIFHVSWPTSFQPGYINVVAASERGILGQNGHQKLDVGQYSPRTVQICAGCDFLTGDITSQWNDVSKPQYVTTVSASYPPHVSPDVYAWNL